MAGRAAPIKASKVTLKYPNKVKINKVICKFPSTPGMYEFVGGNLRAVGAPLPYGYYRVIQFGHDFTFLNRYGEEFSMTIPRFISVKDGPEIALEEKEYFRKQLMQLLDEHNRQVGELQKDHDDRIRAFEGYHHYRTKTVKKDYHDLVEEVQKNHGNRINDLWQLHHNAMSSLPPDALAKEMEAHNGAIEMVQGYHKKSMETVRKNFRVLLKEQQDDHKRLMDQHQKDHEKLMGKQWDGHEQRIKGPLLYCEQAMDQFLKHDRMARHNAARVVG